MPKSHTHTQAHTRTDTQTHTYTHTHKHISAILVIYLTIKHSYEATITHTHTHTYTLTHKNISVILIMISKRTVHSNFIKSIQKMKDENRPFFEKNLFNDHNICFTKLKCTVLLK